MQRFLATVAVIAWGLWFGGTVTLLIAVSSLFQTFASDHTLAGTAASGIFRRFGTCQLVWAAIALLATFGWRLKNGRKRAGVLFMILGLATLCAALTTGWITPRIEAMRVAGETHGSAFKQLHGVSMVVYLLQAIFLFAAGVMFTWIPSPSREPIDLRQR